MKHLLVGTAAALAIVVIGQASAQVPPPLMQQAQWAPAVPYALNAATPEDAYREGLINRWQLEQLTGPLPQAFQGPSANGNRGNDNGGGRQ